MLTLVRDIGRLREISVVLARHGFGELVTRLGLTRGAADIPGEELARGEQERGALSPYERIRLVLQDLGPSFIKLGQIVSTRGDILPPALVTELKKLQEQVPPVPFAAIRAAVEESLGAPLTEVFSRFDEQPLGSASIGQVHRAALRRPPEDPATIDDADVVVKVRRPGVDRTVARDLNLLRRLAVVVERVLPETRLYSPRALVEHFDQAITTEMNFCVEADHAERFAQNFAGVPGVRFPRVYRSASTRDVLTLEFFGGCKISGVVAAGHSGSLLAKQAVAVIIKMIFEDGFFHADPHPGNIIILGPPQAPVIGLIDLGMVGRLGPELRDRTLDLLMAAGRKDPQGVADALYAIGRPTGKVDMNAYRAEVALLAEKYLGRPLKEIEVSSLVRDIVGGASKYGIEVPPDFMLVGKTLMTLEGIGKQLDPELDVLGEAAPHVIELIRRRYSPQRLGNELLRGLMQLGRAGYDLPLHLREVLDDLRLGRLKLQTEDPQRLAAAEHLAQRLGGQLFAAALVLAGAVVLASAHSPITAHVLLGLGGALGALQLLRRRPPG